MLRKRSCLPLLRVRDVCAVDSHPRPPLKLSRSFLRVRRQLGGGYRGEITGLSVLTPVANTDTSADTVPHSTGASGCDSGSPDKPSLSSFTSSAAAGGSAGGAAGGAGGGAGPVELQWSHPVPDDKEPPPRGYHTAAASECGAPSQKRGAGGAGIIMSNVLHAFIHMDTLVRACVCACMHV